MINRDSKCVFVAANAAEAAVVANWLEHEGVPAQVMDRMTLGGLDGLNAWTGVSARGIEVWALRRPRRSGPGTAGGIQGYRIGHARREVCTRAGFGTMRRLRPRERFCGRSTRQDGSLSALRRLCRCSRGRGRRVSSRGCSSAWAVVGASRREGDHLCGGLRSDVHSRRTANRSHHRYRIALVEMMTETGCAGRAAITQPLRG